jgi:cyclase
MFAPATAIVAHERARREVQASNVEFLRQAFPTADFGEIPTVPPTVTFTDRMKVFAGDLEVELIHLGPAHTNNDVIAWVPERKLLFSGDLVFNGGTPFAMAGSVVGWLEVIPQLRALGAERIVPGHGPVCDPSVLDTIEKYLRWIDALSREGHRAGTPPLELARKQDLGEFAGLTDPERIVGNLHRAYAELGGVAPGGNIGVPTAFSDMVAYNGGQPLRCLA